MRLRQAFCLDIRKKTQGEKNSKLKEVTENSSSNPNNVGLFCIFLEISMLKFKDQEAKHQKIEQNSKKSIIKAKTQSYHF